METFRHDAVAIITARSGSKRIPGKNIRHFHGKPLISWPIEILSSSGLFSKVVLSTDSEEIASIAGKAGAEVPFLRPRELADDFTPTAAVANHAIEWLLENGTPPETRFCTVYPAAVAVTADDLVESRKILEKQALDMVFAVCEFQSHPARAWTLTEDMVATAMQPSAQPMRTQDLGLAYHDAGQFYWTRESTWKKIIDGKSILRGGYPMPRSRASDIETEDDWKLASLVFDSRPA